MSDTRTTRAFPWLAHALSAPEGDIQPYQIIGQAERWLLLRRRKATKRTP